MRMKSNEFLSLGNISVFLLGSFFIFLWSGLISSFFFEYPFNIKRLFLSILFGFSLIFLIWTVLCRNEYPDVFHSKRSLSLILLVLFFGSVSSAISEFSYKSVQEVGLYSLLLTSSVFFSAADLDENKIVFLVGLFGLGVCLYTFGYVFNYIVHLQFPPENWSSTLYDFSNPRIFNHAQNWLIPLLAFLPLTYDGKYNLLKRLSWLPIVFMYFFLLLSEGRGVALSLLVAIFTTLTLLLQQSKELTLIHVKSFAAGFAIYIILIQLVPLMLGNTAGFEFDRFILENSTSSGRIELWKVTLQSIQENPIFGIGPQHFITLVGAGPGSPHNIILQWTSEWGIPSAICLIILTVWGGLSYLRGLQHRVHSGVLSYKQQLIQISAFTALLSASIHAQVSGVFITPMSQMLMVLVVGYCLNVHFKYRENKKSVPSWIVSILFILLVFFSLAYFSILYWEYFAGNYSTALFDQPNAPRFWKNGAFHN